MAKTDLQTTFNQRNMDLSVKGHTMAGSTLTDNSWTNDVLWQMNISTYNQSVMMD